jgi:OmpA-OmpF porin, OOP family
MKVLMLAALTVTLSGMSYKCLADDGNFFVSADAGQANYHVNAPYNSPAATYGEIISSSSSNPIFPVGNQLNNTSAAGALRFGYRWHGVVDYGVEAGYADLGKVNSTSTVGSQISSWTDQSNLKDRGWLLGANIKYNLNNDWYVSARGGWYRPQIDGSETAKFNGCVPSSGYVCPLVLPVTTFDRYQYSQTVSGEYFGVGGGFNISSNFSLGLSYDYYRSGRLSNDFSANVGLLSLSAEYRF